jgi:hypothetical protein
MEETMKVRILAAIALTVAAAAARAEMPDYDVKAHCQRISAIGGTPSQMILQGCYQQEQAAYDALKPMWDTLPAALRAHCDHIARIGGGGTFMILQGCIEQETSAAQQNDKFQFKR